MLGSFSAVHASMREGHRAQAWRGKHPDIPCSLPEAGQHERHCLPPGGRRSRGIKAVEGDRRLAGDKEDDGKITHKDVQRT